MPLRKNILMTNSTDIYGGGEFYVFELAQALRNRRLDVTVCCKPDNLLLSKCREAEIPVIPLDFPSGGQLTKYTMRLKGIIAEKEIGLIHTNSNFDRTAGAFAARMAGIKHITNVHSFHSIQYNITHWLRNRLATDHFLVDGYCVKDLLVREDHIPSSKVSIIHLGVEPRMMKRDPQARQRVRNEFGIADDTIVIGNVGRLVPMKGQEFLLVAFATMSAEFPNSRLFIVGDGELMSDLKARAAGLHIGSRTIFAGFRDDLAAVYSAFDLYVHSSVEGGGETFPFAVLQALAEELPVVVTQVGDVAEMVEEGVNGFVIPDSNPSLMALSMARLLRDQNLQKQMARCSYARFLRLFTRERMVDAIEQVYTNLIGVPWQ